MIAVDTSALMAVLLDDVAREYGCPLLFVGGDFRRTGLEAALVVR
ncbi:MAG: hypothetical protein AB7G13_12685 [Lautropia sp.]